jgi:hypothetical protein
VAAQHGNRAIIAYGLNPRARPITSYKLSVRVPGANETTQVWYGDQRVVAFPRAVPPRVPVVFAEGGVYIAITPLAQTDMGSDAPIELDLRDGGMTLDIYNYRGPAKVFWEYASLGGAFYKGNVRNAFVIEVAQRSEYGDIDAFRRHVTAARIDDVCQGYDRSITYACDDGELAMRYSLWDMRLIERRVDGAPYEAPMARAGALDGSGPQWALSAGGTIALGDATLTAPGAISLLADADARRYVVLRTALEPGALRLATARSRIECASFAFGRLELDEAEGTLEIEATEAEDVSVTPAAMKLRIDRVPRDH